MHPHPLRDINFLVFNRLKNGLNSMVRPMFSRLSPGLNLYNSKSMAGYMARNSLVFDTCLQKDERGS